MDIFWMGLIVFGVIVISFFFVFGMTKGVAFVTNGIHKDPVPSSWVSLQVYSGDDCLGHPDLKKISELHEKALEKELEEELENI
ncbi:MAG: hypothetical protein OEM27_01975 [Nitrospinota bacterium]|nr:hypothetical protein [Nitrospinota bacterium]